MRIIIACAHTLPLSPPNSLPRSLLPSPTTHTTTRSLFNKPCHAADHPLEYTLHGVVKAKPAKIRVETTSEAEVPESSSYNYTYGGSYGYGAKEEYLPGTSLIAYLTDEPSETPSGTKSDYYGAAAHGKVLLKYVINWYNDIVTIPNETGEIDTITPGAPVELSNHAHLPLVEVRAYVVLVLMLMLGVTGSILCACEMYAEFYSPDLCLLVTPHMTTCSAACLFKVTCLSTYSGVCIN